MQTVIQLKPELKHLLRKIAVERHTTMKDLISEAIVDLLLKLNYKMDT